MIFHTIIGIQKGKNNGFLSKSMLWKKKYRKKKIVIGGSRFSSTMKYKWFFCVASATLHCETKSKECFKDSYISLKLHFIERYRNSFKHFFL